LSIDFHLGDALLRCGYYNLLTYFKIGVKVLYTQTSHTKICGINPGGTMKAVNRILRIALAATLALSQGAWLAPALAARHSKHQAVIAIGTDELKSEYGAGGGGGGTDPTPDPGAGGGNSCGNIMTTSWDCTLVPYGGPETQEWSYEDGSTWVTNFDALQNTSSTFTFNINCSIEIVNISGAISPGNVELGVTAGQTCAATQDFTAQASLGYRVEIYRIHNVFKRRITQTVAWYRSGSYTGYFGDTVVKELTRRYDSFRQTSQVKI
jgi:hypothetical protein